ncbi:sensor histidine kinase [Petrocella sp. FN5]|uniref:sensor histidine kinase n=1 Tax=Petrocella sp. FN5 TaxID=3032002 RepID=UPI0023D9DFD3|nr:histidine kinase N-terminal 7TM domain-containing protein [Petrocella sp. FN5]MDF1617102.1 histidine kinase N-terminal 7TM domain-containing protein [Petrocella sp. FN5]
MSNEIFYATFYYTLSAFISIAINVTFYLKARKSNLLYMFLKAQGLMILWLLAKVMTKTVINDDDAWIWVVIQYIGVCYFGATFFEFTYYYKKTKKLPKLIRALIYGIPTINYVMVLTNKYHYLFFTSVTIYQNSYGFWFYIHTAFNYIMVVGSYYFLIRTLMDKKDEVSWLQSVLFNVGLLLPIVANIIHVFRLIEIGFDITPIMFNITLLIFGYIAHHYRFLDIKMVTRSMILGNIHEGIIIMDNDRRIIEKNNIIEEITQSHEKLKLIETIDEFIEIVRPKIEDFEDLHKGISRCLDANENRYTTEFRMQVHKHWHCYILKLEKIIDHSKDTIGYVFRIIDITKYNELLTSLEAKNNDLQIVNRQLSDNLTITKQLAVAKERNRISKEVHDILGHSVTLVISLLESCKYNIGKNTDFLKEKTTQSKAIIRGGFFELKKSIKSQSKDVMDLNSLIDDLERLINDYEKSGVNVDFYYKRTEFKLSIKIYDGLYRICQEALTNALKHGHAKNITIRIKHKDRTMDLVIIDDGIGSLNVVKGNGLKGMEMRVADLSGLLSFGSPDGKGFNIHAVLPI